MERTTLAVARDKPSRLTVENLQDFRESHDDFDGGTIMCFWDIVVGMSPRVLKFSDGSVDGYAICRST